MNEPGRGRASVPYPTVRFTSHGAQAAFQRCSILLPASTFYRDIRKRVFSVFGSSLRSIVHANKGITGPTVEGQRAFIYLTGHLC